MGHPTLRQRARELRDGEIASEETDQLVQDLMDTVHDAGGIGLAAPQINVSVRVAVIEVPSEPTRYGLHESVPLTFFINPKITVLNEETVGLWEGCLSVPGFRGYVERPQHIQVNYLDRNGRPQTCEYKGLGAIVCQHEFDHLDGKLYIDRIQDTTKLMFEDQYMKYVASSVDSTE